MKTQMSEAPGDLQTIDDLLALAEFEPELRDVFVEGRGDVHFFGWYFDERGLEATVLAVSDRLYIPRDQIALDAIEYGEREKLVTLARRVSSELPPGQKRITVILDADWQDVTGPVLIHRDCVLVTDFPSMEFYFFTESTMERFQRLGLARQPRPFADVQLSLSGALLDVAAVRLVLRGSRVGCTGKFVELCTLSPSSGADIREILQRSLSGAHASERPANLDSLVEWASDYRQMLVGAAHPGRGHDLAPMLIALFGLRNELAKVEVVEKLMRSTARADELDDFPLFVELRVRLAR